MCISPYHSSEMASSRRRSQPATTPASRGAPRPISTAPAVMSWPACGMLTSSEVLMSLSVPATAITPVPITKLPTISAQRAGGRRALEEEVMPASVRETPTKDLPSW